MEILKNFLYPNKNDILDPLSIVIKLYILSYKPIGTKISILNNKLELQEAGYLQSTIRSINRDTKNDLLNLLFPLTYACEVYLGDIYEGRYRIIFERSLLAFDKLKNVYQLNEITNSIEQLKNIITTFLDNNNFNPKTIIGNWDEPAANLKKSFYRQTNTIWNENRLNVLFGHINEIKDISDDINLNMLLNSFYSYMIFIDTIVIKLIDDMHLLRH